MSNKKSKVFTFLLLLVGWVTTVFSQGWEQSYTDSYIAVQKIVEAENGGYFTAGTIINSGIATALLTRTDIDGKEFWRTSLEALNDYEQIDAIIPRGDHFEVIQSGLKGIVFTQVSATGEVLSVKKVLDDGDGRRIYGVLGDDTENIRLGVGRVEGDLTIVDIIQLNSNRDLMTIQSFDIALQPITAFSNRLNKLVVLNDNTYLFVEINRTLDTSEEFVKLTNFNSSGAILFEKIYNEASFTAYDILISPQNTILISGSKKIGTTESASLLHFTPQGNLIWEKSWENAPIPLARIIKLVLSDDGNYTFLSETNPENNWGLVKVDPDGEEIFHNILGCSRINTVQNLIKTADGGYAVGGNCFGNGGLSEAYLAKVDANGILYSNYIEGTVVQEVNNNCLLDAGDFPLEDWIIKAEGVETAYTKTNALGQYAIPLDTGSYTLSIIPPSNYWNLCSFDSIVHFDATLERDTINILAQAVEDCPLMTVNVSTPFLRRCFPNTYYVNYCNKGTTLAEDAYIDITLDPYVILDDASIPYTDMGDQNFRFEVGNVAPNECGNFTLAVTVDCESTFLGQTHCIKAHIFPDEICGPVDPLWDFSSLTVEGDCTNEFVEFTVRNEGLGDMSTTSAYEIIVDEIMMFRGGVLLPEGQDTIIKVPVQSDRFTYRIQVDQSLGHPGEDRPSATIEACGVPPFELGFWNNYAQNDGDTFIDIDCHDNIGSFDPNDKQGFPKGYAEEHFIDEEEAIQYHIRFQNTGTDTAFTVVVRDTIDSNLDIGSLEIGTSSHDFDWELAGEGILKFTFNNILLPDSTTNEPSSHGFIRFKITPKTATPLGTRIENEAAIYFDFNEPIITNTVYHTLGEEFITENLLSNIITEESASIIRVYPNPFCETAIFEVMQGQVEPVLLEVYTATGQLVKQVSALKSQLELDRAGLAPGIYFFSVFGRKRVRIDTGKIIVAK